MSLPLEAVPNFSAASNRGAVRAIHEALASRTAVLDVHTDTDHNRSVFTVAGPAEELGEALFAAVAVALERIDVRDHEGIHPRIGVADVLPIVPLNDAARPAAHALARTLGERLATELELPVFLYGELCPAERLPEGARPAHYRRGGLDELRERLAEGQLRPDLGPSELHPSGGAALVGSRAPLIAFNVELETDDLSLAREIAAQVRETGGGFTSVRALGLKLESSETVQVSMNIEDWSAAPPHRVVAAIEAAAAARGVAVARSELVGLMPVGAALAAGADALRLPALGPESLLELRLLEQTVAASTRPREADGVEAATRRETD